MSPMCLSSVQNIRFSVSSPCSTTARTRPSTFRSVLPSRIKTFMPTRSRCTISSSVTHSWSSEMPEEA